jgi:aminopeptidase-like protein/spore coat polysaccharide biosynthesis protein SpsF (cytidylyltransferase family)
MYTGPIRVVALVQARMGSKRFPGKMLMPLGGRPILEWVLHRVKQARTLDKVVLATSDTTADEGLADLARANGVKVFRGSENDVLARFAGAAKEAGASIVVRICADNPFVDPREIDRLVTYFAGSSCDYACNHQDRLGSRYADGFGAEILRTSLLKSIAEKVTEARHREHVTLYLWEHASEYRLCAVAAPDELAFPELRFDIDTPGDLVRLERLVRAGVVVEMTATDIIRIAKANRCSAGADFPAVVCDELDTYLQRLFPLCRSITGNPNRETLRILRELVPLTIHEVPSGTAVYDWTIPDEWNISDAWIADSTGRRIVDFKVSNLHVVSYSVPVRGEYSWQELQPHLHIHPDLPNAIPYRTSYYKRDWGFCLTHYQYHELEQTAGSFQVVIDSRLAPGSLTYGELILPGRSRREVLLSCYICHPSMANDNLSGVLLTAFLARNIAAMKDRHWSYRIVFVPETIGAVTYCACNEREMKAIDMGLVVTTVGGKGGFGYKQSWQADHPLNRMIETVLEEAGVPYTTYEFDIHGSDERQYSSQGFRINAATICRDRYYEYTYYHTSLDDLSFVSGAQIAETYGLYVRLISLIEGLRIYKNQIPNCEAMLSRHGLYPTIGGALRPPSDGMTETDMTLWLLFLCDGRTPLQSIAERLGVIEAVLQQQVDRLIEARVLAEV